MATQKKSTAFQAKINLMTATMAAMMVLYILFVILAAFNSTATLLVFYAAVRMGLLAGVAAIGATYFYLRPGRKPGVTKSSGPSGITNTDARKELDNWLAELADTIRTRSQLTVISLPAAYNGVKNQGKLTNAIKSVWADIDSLKGTNSELQALTESKDKQIGKLETTLGSAEASIAKLKSEKQQATRETEEQKQTVAAARIEMTKLSAEMEVQKKEALAKIDRYRNISKFLEQAKSSLYSKHGPGKDFLVQLKLGLLADDAINMSNKNDYHSLNYELFRNGRSFADLLREQPPIHIDAYPEAVKKLRQWIKTAGLESEDWQLFYQNYPIADKA